jgi:predicted ester cyclase
MLRAAFPDFHYTIDDVFSSGDKVVLRVTASGTQRGELMGHPASGRRAEWTEIHIVRVRGGKLAEHWTNMDQLGMLQQLQAIPVPEHA